MTDLLKWQVYELSAKTSSLNGVMLRGRIRKFGIENKINVLAENTEDVENGVRIAVLSTEDHEKIIQYLKSIVPDIQSELVLPSVVNPVLSKLKVNIESRYSL